MSAEKSIKAIKTFSEIAGSRNPFGTEKVARLDEYINKEVIIKDFVIDEGPNFNMAYILVVDPETREEVTLRTTSQVIQKQLQMMEQYLKEGIAVKAVIRKRKRYLTFE